MFSQFRDHYWFDFLQYALWLWCFMLLSANIDLPKYRLNIWFPWFHLILGLLQIVRVPGEYRLVVSDFLSVDCLRFILMEFHFSVYDFGLLQITQESTTLFGFSGELELILVEYLPPHLPNGSLDFPFSQWWGINIQRLMLSIQCLHFCIEFFINGILSKQLFLSLWLIIITKSSPCQILLIQALFINILMGLFKHGFRT